SVSIGLFFGLLFGMSSAYFGGKLDLLLQRLMDSMQAFPSLILALAIVAALEPSVLNVTLAISAGLIPRNNRVVRGAVPATKANVYVDAARAIGSSNARVMLRHIL